MHRRCEMADLHFARRPKAQVIYDDCRTDSSPPIAHRTIGTSTLAKSARRQRRQSNAGGEGAPRFPSNAAALDTRSRRRSQSEQYCCHGRKRKPYVQRHGVARQHFALSFAADLQKLVLWGTSTTLAPLAAAGGCPLLVAAFLSHTANFAVR